MGRKCSFMCFRGNFQDFVFFFRQNVKKILNFASAEKSNCTKYLHPYSNPFCNFFLPNLHVIRVRTCEFMRNI